MERAPGNVPITPEQSGRSPRLWLQQAEVILPDKLNYTTRRVQYARRG